MQKIFAAFLLSTLSLSLMSCDFYRKLHSMASESSEASLGGADLELIAQSLTATVAMDTGYISDENLPFGHFETKTATKSHDVDGNSRREKSEYSFEKSSLGIVNISKDFTGEFSQALGTYEITSNANYIYTPDAEIRLPFTGTIQLDSAMSYRRDKGDTQVFNIVAKDLHRSSCGLDEGSIEFSNTHGHYFITYSGCGLSQVSKR